MPYIRITAEAMAVVRAAKLDPTTDFPERDYVERGDGMVDVWLEGDTVERLKSHVLEGETISDTVIRLFSVGSGVN